MSGASSKPEWMDNEGYVLFIVDEDSELPVGATEDYNIVADAWARIRGRPLEDVQENFARVGSQIKALLDKVPREQNGFALSEIDFGLAFSAEGQLAFVAKAGVEASIRMKFVKNE